MNTALITKNDRRLIPLTDWPKHHAWPPLGGLRHLVFHAEATGFNKVIRRIGRRLLIDEQAFFDWIETSNKFEKKEKYTNARS